MVSDRSSSAPSSERSARSSALDVVADGEVGTGGGVWIEIYTELAWTSGTQMRLTALTPSRIVVRTSTQTFLPCSHFDTAFEKLYDRSKPVTAKDKH